jgi:NAD(P)H-quinone oxidoreductase subunit I
MVGDSKDGPARPVVRTFYDHTQVSMYCSYMTLYTNCLSMTEEYELSTYDRHVLNYNQIALSRLPISIMGDYTIQTIKNSPQRKLM